jgi:hypothetical protein
MAAEFAAAHGKATAISEWGVQSNDSGTFVKDMAAWLESHHVLYDNYWESNASFNGVLTQYPNAAAAYKAAFAQTASASNHPALVSTGVATPASTTIAGGTSTAAAASAVAALAAQSKEPGAASATVSAAASSPTTTAAVADKPSNLAGNSPAPGPGASDSAVAASGAAHPVSTGTTSALTASHSAPSVTNEATGRGCGSSHGWRNSEAHAANAAPVPCLHHDAGVAPQTAPGHDWMTEYNHDMHLFAHHFWS